MPSGNLSFTVTAITNQPPPAVPLRRVADEAFATSLIIGDNAYDLGFVAGVEALARYLAGDAVPDALARALIAASPTIGAQVEQARRP